MMTVCASHIDSSIVYEHFGGSGGGKIGIVEALASHQVDRDQTLPNSSQTWVQAIIER